ncbi:hypothetical protein BST13_08800 [Mycobacterium aquaticum]|uniref:Histidine phosphatase family protein n=2 Tax=Mycobacterium aquaticum TaxID=1927124 RepID=A0A1X0B4L6_9MYCO|nr:hypothetical protein BST13_08800 [Mycobacterium aquaticum]
MENYMRTLSGRRTAGAAATTLTACALLAATALPASAMTVTFIRHGESYGNATNKIDTSIPGPDLTPKGEGQADAVAAYLTSPAYTDKYGPVDAIYASTMVRTQETAKPLSTDLNLPVTVIGYPKNSDAGERIGVQEISAGIFEGLPEQTGIGRIGYIVAPLAWTLGLQFVPVPGGETGLEFNERMNNSMKQIEADTPAGEDGNQNAAVFSHGATIMFWTMMNVDNPNLLLIVQHPLTNGDVVVVDENADGGWTLKSWAGEEVGPANYPTQMFVNVRDLIVAPQQAVYNMRVPALTPDPAAIVSTGAQGVQDVAKAGVKFVKDSVTDTVNAITSIPNALNDVTPATHTLNTDSAPATKLTSSTDGDAAKVIRKVNGATNLTAGNKAPSGKGASVARQRVRDTVKKLTNAGKTTNSGSHSTSKDAA